MVRSGYLPSLDGLRAASILLVLVGHAEISSRSPGGFGVTVFFFLSGYLITTLLLREQDRYGTISMRQFYLRRVLRLMPPLVLTLAAAMLLSAFGLARGQLDLGTLTSQVLFYFNYYAQVAAPQFVEGLGILWSLSVEEHFYLIWPAIFVALMRNTIRMRHLVLLLAIILAWRYYRVIGWGDPDWKIYFSTDTRFDSLLYGCILAIVQQRYPDFDRRFRSGPAMYAILALSLGVLLFTLAYRDEMFRSTLRYSLQGIALMPIFHFAVNCPDAIVFRPLNWAIIRRIGVWSYTMYLSHYVIMYALAANDVAAFGSLSILLWSLALSCLWSALVFELAEKPLMPWRRRLSVHPGSVPQGAAAD